MVTLKWRRWKIEKKIKRNKKHGRFGFWRGQLAFKWSNSVSARASASTVNRASGRVGQENSTRSLVLFWGRQVELGWRWLDISGMGPFFVARVKELFPTGQVERGYTWSGKKNERTVLRQAEPGPIANEQVKRIYGGTRKIILRFGDANCYRNWISTNQTRN